MDCESLFVQSLNCMIVSLHKWAGLRTPYQLTFIIATLFQKKNWEVIKMISYYIRAWLVSQPPASVDGFVLAERILIPFMYTDENSAHQEEEERSAETDGHDGDHQWREEFWRRSPDSRQHGPEKERKICMKTTQTNALSFYLAYCYMVVAMVTR